MNTLAYVDSLTGLRAAQIAGCARIVSDNPLLVSDPRSGGVIENIDALMSQDEANLLGATAIDLAIEIDNSLRTSRRLGDIGLDPSQVQLAGSSSRLLSALTYRAAIFERAIENRLPDAIRLFVHDVPVWNSRHPLMLSRLGNPYIPLSAIGFFAPASVVIEPIHGIIQSTPRRDMRWKLALRLSMLPVGIIFYLAARQTGTFRAWPNLRGAFFIGGENEALRESLPWLALAGFRLRHIGDLRDELPEYDDSRAPANQHQDLASAIERTVVERLSGLLPARPATAVAAVAAARIAHAMTYLAQIRPLLRRALEQQRRGDDIELLLTNGLFGPSGALTYAVCREAGLRVVDFEHGVTTGISEHSQRKVTFSEASTSDLLLVCSESAASAFGRSRACATNQRIAVGLADQTRKLLRPKLRRRLVRAALKLRAQETVLMHVSAWPYQSSFRPGYGAPTETAVFELERALIQKAYANLPYTVLFKPYPAVRMVHQPSYDGIFDLPGNVRLAPDEDFRYLRAAADVIVTGVPTSTLGWAAGSGVPLIWLDSERMMPLLAEMRDRFQRAFLFVDIDSPDWCERLRKWLLLPHRDLERCWLERESARTALYRDTIFGPAGSCGRNAASAIRSYLRELRHQPDRREADSERGVPDARY